MCRESENRVCIETEIYRESENEEYGTRMYRELENENQKRK